MKTFGVLLLGLVLGFAFATAIWPVRAAHEWDTSHDNAYRLGKQQAEREVRDRMSGYGSGSQDHLDAIPKRNPC